MTPPPLLSHHAKHGKFAKRINSTEMPNYEKRGGGVTKKRKKYFKKKLLLTVFCLLSVCFVASLKASMENGDIKIYPALSITSGGGVSSQGALTLSGASIGGLTDSTEAMSSDNFTMNAGPILASVVLDISKQSLSAAHCYPVPFKPIMGHTRIRFTGLTRTTQIMIYALSGIIIKTIYKSDGNDFIDWDVRNNKGEPVFSGVYFYLVKDAFETKTGKLMIIR